MIKNKVILIFPFIIFSFLLIVGYVWLLFISVLLIFPNGLVFGYDAALHSFFIGFIFSMIFSHAVIILPAITKWMIKLYRPFLYLWFALLPASLIISIVVGLFEDVDYKKNGGTINGVSILLFFASIVLIMRSEIRKMRISGSSQYLNRPAVAAR